MFLSDKIYCKRKNIILTKISNKLTKDTIKFYRLSLLIESIMYNLYGNSHCFYHSNSSRKKKTSIDIYLKSYTLFWNVSTTSSPPLYKSNLVAFCGSGEV